MTAAGIRPLPKSHHTVRIGRSQPLIGEECRAAAETLSEEAGAFGSHTNEVKQGQPVFREEIYDFSLVLGDPVFLFLRKARLSGDHLELLYRRLITITSIACVPLLLLDRLGSQAASIGRLSFLHDVEVQARFLVAHPVLIGAELIVHSSIRPVVRRFVERGIVRVKDLPRFEAAIEAAAGLRIIPSPSKWRFLSLFSRLDCGSGTADSALTPQPGMRCQAAAGILPLPVTGTCL